MANVTRGWHLTEILAGRRSLFVPINNRDDARRIFLRGNALGAFDIVTVNGDFSIRRGER